MRPAAAAAASRRLPVVCLLTCSWHSCARLLGAGLVSTAPWSPSPTSRHQRLSSQHMRRAALCPMSVAPRLTPLAAVYWLAARTRLRACACGTPPPGSCCRACESEPALAGACCTALSLTLPLLRTPGLPFSACPPHPTPPHALSTRPVPPTSPRSKVPKKVTNVAFTADGRHMLAADKFGDVLAASTEKPAGRAPSRLCCTHSLLGLTTGSTAAPKAVSVLSPRSIKAARRERHNTTPSCMWLGPAPPLALPLSRPAGLKEGQQQEPEILLGHYCAILTSLSLSSGGRLLATTDRCAPPQGAVLQPTGVLCSFGVSWVGQSQGAAKPACFVAWGSVRLEGFAAGALAAVSAVSWRRPRAVVRPLARPAALALTARPARTLAPAVTTACACPSCLPSRWRGPTRSRASALATPRL